MVQAKPRLGRSRGLRFWLWAIVWCAFNLPTHAQTTGTGTDQNRPGTANKGKARTEENLNLETDPAELYVALKGTNGTNTALQELKVRVADTISGTVSVSLASIPSGRVTFWTGCNDSTATQVTSLDVGTSWVSVWLRGENVSGDVNTDKLKVQNKEVPLTVIGTYFTPDPNTHLTSDRATILPGDTEKVSTSVLPTAAFSHVRYVTGSTDRSKFQVGATFVGEVQAISATEELVLLGRTTGSTVLQARIDGSTGPVCGAIPVLVGGTMVAEYNQAPTVQINTSGGGITLASSSTVSAASVSAASASTTASSSSGDTVELGGAPVNSGAPDARASIATGLINTTNATPACNATFRVVLFDGNGNPKKGKEIRLSFDNTVTGVALLSSSLTSISTTDATGKTEASVTAGFQIPQSSQDLSCLLDNVAVLAGRAAREFNPTSPGNVNAIRNTQKFTTHTNTFHSLRYEQEIVTANGETFITAFTLDMPILNHTQYLVVQQALEGGIYGDLTDATGTLTYSDGLGGTVTEAIPSTVYPFNVPSIRDGIIVPHAISSFASSGITAQVQPVDPANPPPGWTGKAVTYGAIAAEIGLGLVPGADFIDVCKEFFWKPVVNGTSGDRTIGLIAFFGLCADAGYAGAILAPVAVPANVALAAVKAVFKRIPEPARDAMVHLGGSALGSAKKLMVYMARAPGAPTLAGAADKASAVLSQWNKVLNSPLLSSGNPAEHLKDAVDVLTNKATRHYTDDAVVGVAVLAKNGKKGVAEGLYSGVLAGASNIDDLAEGTFDVLRKLDGTTSGVSDLVTFGDSAVEGVAALIRKADASVASAKPVAEKVLDLGVTDAKAAFTKIRNFTDDDAFKGVKELVTDAGNADAVKAVTSAAFDDDVIQATFKARHIEVFDDPAIAGKVGEYVQKAKTLFGTPLVIVSGNEFQLARAYGRSGINVTVGSETVSDLAVLREGMQGTNGWGRAHIFDEIRSSGLTRAQEIVGAGYAGINTVDDVNSLIKATIETGTIDGNVLVKSFPHSSGGTREFKVFLATGSPGSITTVVPGDVLP